jgi:hypothetical protein
MIRETTPAGLEESRQLIENHRAWTARAFCMATAELRGTLEPDRPVTAVRTGESRPAAVTSGWKTPEHRWR